MTRVDMVKVIAMMPAPTAMTRVAGASCECIVAERMCDAAVTMPAVTIAPGDNDDDDHSTRLTIYRQTAGHHRGG